MISFPEYLQDLSEVLMFLLLPPADFHNKPFRYIVRVRVRVFKACICYCNL